MTCSRNGVLSTGTIALGMLQVRGRSLVASPPIRIIAFIALLVLVYWECLIIVFYHKSRVVFVS